MFKCANDSHKDTKKISYEEIGLVIEEMSINKANGPDNISPFMIKKGGNSLISSLEKMFNRIWNNGVSPKHWFEAIVVPIPKLVKNVLKTDEFRPISLTSVCGKLFEKIIVKRINTICETNNWLPELQNGFRRKKSTINSLLKLQQEIHCCFKRKMYMATAFLDIKKSL